MATVIESLIVTLGLDATNFRRGTADAGKARKTLADNSKKLDDEAKKREKELEKDRKAQAKEAEKRAKEMGERIAKVRNQVLSLFAIFTAGVGIKNFIANTVESAVQLGYLSQNLKVSIESLQAYGRAAERAGGTTEGAFAQLRESADSLAALRSGLGPNEGMQWFFRMGGSSDDLKDGNTYLMARSKIISEMFNRDPQRAMLISKQMGISEDQFNLIKQGPEAIKRLTDAQMKNSAISAKDAEGALELKNKWLDFTQAMTATGTKILVALIPAFSQLMNWLQSVSLWITDHKDEIGKWVTDVVAKIIPVMQKIGKFLAEIDWDGANKKAAMLADAIMKIAESIGFISDNIKKYSEGKTNILGMKKLPGDTRFMSAEDVQKDKIANPEKYAPTVKSSNPILGYIQKKNEQWAAQFMAFFGNEVAKDYLKNGSLENSSSGNGNFGALEKKYGLPSGLLDSVWQQESSRGKNMLSPKGAQGHFGFMPKTAAAYGLKDPNDLAESSDAAARMYRDLLKSNGGNLPGALASYNWGSGNVARQGMGAAPRETRDYISGVMGRMGASNAAQRGSTSTSTSTSDMKIGTVNIQTQATDAQGIASGFENAMRAKFRFSDQANSGMQ